MKGIYLTQEGKEEIEAKIRELENQLQLVGNLFEDIELNHSCLSIKLRAYKEILSSATVLPVEESWYNVIENVESESQSLILQTPFIMKSLYEHGVIIQPK